MQEILIATKNKHKVIEYQAMLSKFGYKVISLLDINQEIEIEETGTTFKENASIKANYLANLLNVSCIADDSGIEVRALNNEPGIYSARYLGEDTSYDIKNQSLIDRVKDCDDRYCRFVCVIALANVNQETIFFEGIIEGEVAYTIKGDNGFGYDPMFYLKKYQKTLAELDFETKNIISHRYSALNKLLGYLNEK